MYDALAQEIASGALFFSSHPYPPGPFPPGYPLSVSLSYLLSTGKYAAFQGILVMNAIITSLIIFPAFFILRRFVPAPVSVAGALLVSLLPSVSMHSFFIMSEALFIPLFLVSIWCIMNSFSRSSPSICDLLTGTTLFLLFYTRAAGLSMILAWILASGLFLFTEREETRWVLIKKMSFVALPGAGLYGAWITDQIWFKGALPSGYSTHQYLSEGVRILLQDPLHVLYVILLHTDYILLSAFVIFPLLIPGMIRLLSADIQSTFSQGEGRNKATGDRRSPIIPLLVYVSVSAGFIFLFGISHTIQPFFEYKLCGRYMDPIIPVIVLAGIIGLENLVRQKCGRRFVLHSAGYLALLSILTGMVMLPFAHEPNNNLGLYYLYSFSTEYMVPLFALLTGLILGGVIWFTIRIGKGTVITLLLISLIVLTSSLPIFTFIAGTSAKTGSLLPFCQELHDLDTSPGSFGWDRSEEENVWDGMVYYTLKFWLGQAIQDVSPGTCQSPVRPEWMIQNMKGQNCRISSDDYCVIPVGVQSPLPP